MVLKTCLWYLSLVSLLYNVRDSVPNVHECSKYLEIIASSPFERTWPGIVFTCILYQCNQLVCPDFDLIVLQLSLLKECSYSVIASGNAINWIDNYDSKTGIRCVADSYISDTNYGTNYAILVSVIVRLILHRQRLYSLSPIFAPSSPMVLGFQKIWKNSGVLIEVSTTLYNRLLSQLFKIFFGKKIARKMPTLG